MRAGDTETRKKIVRVLEENGPGYFQPDKHPCAKYYHEAGINPSLDEALNSGDGSYKP